MAHLYTTVQRNTPKEAIINVLQNGTDGFVVTGGQIRLVSGASADIPLVTGYRTENQGGTITTTDFANTETQKPWPSTTIKSMTFGNSQANGELTIYAVTEHNMQEMFVCNQTGVVTFPGGQLQSSLTGNTYGIYVSGDASDSSVMIHLIQDQTFS